MHRAVSARLSNPKISLFEALKIGGFEYEQDNDANALDNEHITLGQRKNQLSRRVRLARQQKKEQKVSVQQQLPPDASLSGVQHAGSRNVSGLASFGGGSTPVTGNKRPFVMDEGDGGLSEDPAAKMLSSDLPSDEAAALQQQSDQSRIMAKNHPGYHPILLQQRIVPTTSNPSQNMANSFLMNQNFSQGGPILPLQHHHQQQQPVSIGNFAAQNANLSAASPGTDLSSTFPSQFPIAMQPSLLDINSHQPQQPQQQPPKGSAFAGAAPQQQQQGGDAPIVVTNASSLEASMNSSRASPPQDPQAPAGVTIASLNQSAASVGMSLEQLAMALRSSNNLVQILQSGRGSAPTQAQQDLAVSLYQSENCSLYERSMLRAGYPSEIAQNKRSPQYLQMAFSAWQAEGERLQALMNPQQELMDPPLVANAPSGSGPSGNSGASGGGGSGGSAPRPNDHSQSHDYHHGHQSHQQEDSTRSSGGGGGFGGGCAFEGGRHIHRLEGKCGHKAILHQPADGTAHIDFVVGDRVECYHGVEPLSSNAKEEDSSTIKIWPSNYKCKDLSCRNKCKGPELENKTKCHKHGHSEECMVAGDPKILDLDDIDLGGKEWNSDFSNGDTVLGLFKLGDTRPSSTVNDGLSSHHSFDTNIDGESKQQQTEMTPVKE